MDKRYITMLEVSQKQAYIFASNKLKDNVINSAIIAEIMSPEYFEKTVKDETLFSKDKNLVYSGGGHTVLEFPTKEQAQKVCQMITTKIREEYHGIEVFAKTIPYKERDEEGNVLSPSDNLKNLTKELEKKKSVRCAVFHQGTFGVEKIDTDTMQPILASKEKQKEMPDKEKKIEKSLIPTGYKAAEKFEDLGGDKNRSNFIAVVHIDGNAMGKRIEELNKEEKIEDWENYKQKMRRFSESIDDNFKSAYRTMNKIVAQNLEEDKEKKEEDRKFRDLKLKDKYFPIRRIITAGDDICFVTEGRIGLECAALFIKALRMEHNVVDGKSYSACAGVAIVHQKYPFYRAYELAELLCSNAKRFGASYEEDGLGRNVSAIDWHIEFGEMSDSLEEIRKKYETLDGNRLELRPYIVTATDEINQKEKIRQYSNFQKLMKKMSELEDSYARGKIKNLRTVLKQGETSSKNYIEFYKLKDLLLEGNYGIYREVDISKVGRGEGLEQEIFINTAKNDEDVKRSYLFDAIEMMDTYITFDYTDEDLKKAKELQAEGEL
ncbi:MAG: hypothetical protein UDS45_08590 [Lachnospiraceae bacterium]|jgi:hypothetical protein|nr:hypothetical protein [Lachnospiraceae bacterium]